MPDPRSLYDQYRLSNSSVVPIWQGSTAPEALQVGQFQQNQYDMAKETGAVIDSEANNISALDKDMGLANEVRNHVKGKLDEFSSARDWENRVGDVRQLGRYYADRARELAAPIKQMQDYKEKQLENKDLNLTPYQKQTLMAMSQSRYGGLQKDSFGKFVGSFQGVEPAKNVDMTKFTDDAMQGMKEFENASKIDHISEPGREGYIVTRGGKHTWVSGDRVKQAVADAIALRPDVQAHIAQESTIAGFNASKVNWDQVPDEDPNKQFYADIARKQGTSINEVYARSVQESTRKGIVSHALHYAETKYAFDKKESEYGLKDDPAAARADAKKAQFGLTGDVVADVGLDLTKKYGNASNLQTQGETANTNLGTAQTNVAATKNMIATESGVKVGDLTGDHITKFFNKHPAMLSQYKADIEASQISKGSLDEINAIKDDAMDIAARKAKPGFTGVAGLREDATNKLSKSLEKTGLDIPLRNDAGVEIAKLNKNTAKNFTVVDGDYGVGAGKDNYITLRDKSGQEFKVYTGFGRVKGAGVQNAIDSPDLREIGKNFDGINWKEGWDQAATNIRSNSLMVPIINDVVDPTTGIIKKSDMAHRVSAVLAAGSGALKLKDSDNNDITDSDDQKNIRARLSSGNFKVNGITKREDGSLYAKVSVLQDKDAKDPADQYKTFYVGASSNISNRLSDAMLSAGKELGDDRTTQIGAALRPGSGYEAVLNMGTTNRTYIRGKSLDPSKQGPKEFEIVPNISTNPSSPVTYEVFKTDADGNRLSSAFTASDAFDMGLRIDIMKQQGKTIEKNNAR